MKQPKKIMLTLLVFLFLIVSALNVLAQGSPQLPHIFYGTSEINGGGTPTGFVITAKVSGVEKGSITTEEVGKYGGKASNQKKLLVQGNIDDDAVIEFYILDVKAGQTAAFKSGKIEELNLTWAFPNEILFESNVDNESFLCTPESDIKVTASGLIVEISCSENTAAKINNVSNLGNQFFITAQGPSGTQNISSTFEISVTGNVEIIVTISYDDTGIDESTVKPYKFVDGVWIELPDGDIISRDTAANTITFKISPGGTPYAAFGSAPAPQAPVVQQSSSNDGSSSGSSGGIGGSSGGGSGCTYDWQCTAWSECKSNSKQTRTCINKGTCADTFGKPSEVEDCYYIAQQVELEAKTDADEPLIPEEKIVTTSQAAPTQEASKNISNNIVLVAIVTFAVFLIGIYAGYLYSKKK